MNELKSDILHPRIFFKPRDVTRRLSRELLLRAKYFITIYFMASYNRVPTTGKKREKQGISRRSFPDRENTGNFEISPEYSENTGNFIFFLSV